MVRLAGTVSYGTKGNVQVGLSGEATLLNLCKEMLNRPRRGRTRPKGLNLDLESFEILGESELPNSQPVRHFFVKKAFPYAVGLYPFSIDDELGDGTFAGLFDYFFGGTGSAFDIDVSKRKIVLPQKAFRDAAIRAPRGRIDGDFHCWVYCNLSLCWQSEKTP